MQLQAEKQKANCSFLIKAEGIFCLYYSQIVLSFGIVDKIVAGSVKTKPLKKALVVRRRQLVDMRVAELNRLQQSYETQLDVE
ncbi:hypothetical protein F9874_08905 [Glaesserella parasuis]|uniref:hypothetical protein n=1 Tax=Glaesserella parasuis TaxID=738 RepID=UPI001324E245|nr:hypothetical protein [Glaesserella parasuis]MDG6248735.1 hypothetical protein [Glaesserella parasuis]MDG6268358.1 hypothetical protein [Glaesserella parasuis]MDO9759104.1 hypothetical protein [Glaesserella parasuis]MDP0337834.1 hypothetical protein [Glaesserella parasuis]MWQ37831.1 hypothetical protein [Glaesserella parasuis]